MWCTGLVAPGHVGSSGPGLEPVSPALAGGFLLLPCFSKMEPTCRTLSHSLLAFESKAHEGSSHRYSLSHLSTCSCKGGWKRKFSGFYLGKEVLTMCIQSKYQNIGECSKMLASSNNRGSITIREAWPRCPSCRKTWAQCD